MRTIRLLIVVSAVLTGLILFAVPAWAQTATLTNKGILDMVKGGLAAEIILAKIQTSPCDFDTSSAALIEMKAAGVPDAVILAVVTAGSPGTKGVGPPQTLPQDFPTTQGLANHTKPAPGSPKEYPKAEVFAGGSFLRSEGQNYAGWQGSVAGNFHRNIGVVGDFGGQYTRMEGVGVSSYQFLLGPRFSVRGERFTAFTHFLGGRANVGAGLEGISVRFSGPALACGGGVDVNLGKYVAIRVMQLDWVMTRILGEWQTHNVRYGTGVVFRFGGT